MKRIADKVANFLKLIFGYSVTLCLFVGGFSFFGYIIALIEGGSTASLICNIIYEKIYPCIVIISTSTILLGLIQIYIAGNCVNKNK